MALKAKPLRKRKRVIRYYTLTLHKKSHKLLQIKLRFNRLKLI